MVTIHISENEMIKILRWGSNNRDRLKHPEGKFPYKSFAIKVTVKNEVMNFNVELRDNSIDEAMIFYNFSDKKDFMIFDNNFESFVDGYLQTLKDKNDKVGRKSAWFSYVAITSYIVHKMNKRKTIIVESNKVISNSNKNKTRLNKTSKPREVFLLDDFVQYEHKEPTGIKHNITCPAWEVKGHERHYKSGKVVWVKGFKKGKARNDAPANDIEIFLKKG